MVTALQERILCRLWVMCELLRVIDDDRSRSNEISQWTGTGGGVAEMLYLLQPQRLVRVLDRHDEQRWSPHLIMLMVWCKRLELFCW